MASTPYIAPPSEGRRLPAAGRVAIYLGLWLGAYCFVQVPFAIYGIVRAARSGRLSAGASPAMGGDLSKLLGWPALGLLEWSALLATLAVTWLMVQRIDREPFTVIGFNWPRIAPAQWLVGVVLGGLLMGSVLVVGIAVGWFHVTGVAPPGQAVWLAVGTLLFLLPAAAVEEISMRGYVLRVLAERYGWRAALAVSAALFAALHVANPGFFTSVAPLLGLVLAGIYLGAAYVVSGRLYLPIAVHTAWNLFEGPVCGFRVSGLETPSIIQVRVSGPPLWTGGAFGPEAGLLLAVALLVHLPLLVIVGRRLCEQTPAETT
jgi:membrane protease YdiL (CAAX protease family)